MEYSLRTRRIDSGGVGGRGSLERHANAMLRLLPSLTPLEHQWSANWSPQARVTSCSIQGACIPLPFLSLLLPWKGLPVVQQLLCPSSPGFPTRAVLAPGLLPNILLLVKRKQGVLQELTILFLGWPPKPLISLLGKHAVYLTSLPPI